MRNRRRFSALSFISLAFILIALVLTTLQLARFSRVREFLPARMVIADVPVGGLNREQASQRILEAYSVPVQMRYNGALIQMDPSEADFKVDVDSMLAIADLERTQKLFWQDFWDYLWGRGVSPKEVPLSATANESSLRTFLTEVARRYDQPATSAMPVVGTVNFTPGAPGEALDADGSVLLIENALKSLTNRVVDLPIKRQDPPRPAFQNLEVLLKQTIRVSGFDGIAGVYLLDLQNFQELHFAIRGEEELSVEPDIAFTASSTIKVPIMVSVFRRLTDPPDEESMRLLVEVVDKSGNEAADWLMDRVMEQGRSPLLVAEDMQTLGLKNTFLAGYFSAGSALLQRFETPANTRTDINTDPDPYSQTTTSDLGMLLGDLYQCANTGGGALVAVFPNEITQSKCNEMIQLLVDNKLPFLLTAGIPEGTKIAHKHGWVSTGGVINTIGDAGIVYTPGGNYIVVIFLNHPVQLVWDPASALISELSRAVYNYYNLPAP